MPKITVFLQKWPNIDILTSIMTSYLKMTPFSNFEHAFFAFQLTIYTGLTIKLVSKLPYVAFKWQKLLFPPKKIIGILTSNMTSHVK